MNKSRYSLPITFSVKKEYSGQDGRFLSVEIDVLHTGLNLNDSVFDKDIVDAHIESIKNTPILGFIRVLPDGEKDFKGHEHVIVKVDKDGVERKYRGSAYGVIPESCNPRWIKKMCDDGVEREFLQVDGLLWTKFSDCKEIMERDIIKPHSMELFNQVIDGYEDEDGHFHFTEFSFDGCCILGDGIDPAMVNSEIRLNEVEFTMSDFVKNLQREINDTYTSFTKLVNEENNQGGIAAMPNTDFAQTVLEQFSDIAAEVSQFETMRSCWGGDVPRYRLVDIQDNEVIVVDGKDCYRYYGFAFTIEGDKPVIDFTSGNRKKLRYEQYEEGSAEHDGAFDFGKHIEEIEKEAFSKVSEANEQVAKVEAERDQAVTDYNALKGQYDEIEPKYNEYVKADEERKAEQLKAMKDEKFAKYEADLAGDEEFAAIKARKDELSVEEIDKECALVFWKVSRAKTNFSRQQGDPMVVEVIDEHHNDPNVYTSERYGNIRITR